MENNENQIFNYTYNAKQQEEIKAIRKKYAPVEQSEDKMAQIRRMDAAVTQKATMYSLVVGIVGALILGCGMSLVMTDFASILGAFQNMAMPVGIAIGIVGIALAGAAYPIYNRTIKKEREKIAPQILTLTDELMK